MRTIIATIAATLAVAAIVAVSGVGLSSSNVPRSVDSASAFDPINIDSHRRPDDFRPGLGSPIKWPQYYDGVPQFSEWTDEPEWTRDNIKELTLDGADNVFKTNPVAALPRENNPMDIDFGPTGALYPLEDGERFFVENEDAQVAGIDFGESQDFFVAAGPHLRGLHNYQDTNRHTSADTPLILASANAARDSHDFQLAA
jgi:hypothetical protein